MKQRFYYCIGLSRNFFAQKNYFPHQNSVSFSEKFCNFFSENFETLFVSETGIKPSSKVTITIPNRDDSPQFYQQGLVSRLNPVLWIIPDYYDDISFCWKSKTGKIIQPTDEDFDVDDLECWMEGLKPAAYWKEVATEKKAHPFQIGGLPFTLKVYSFDVDMELRLELSSTSASVIIEKIIADVINNFNLSSEENNRKNGVVHNYSFISEETLLTLRIDTGSAGVEIIKEILKSLKKCEGIVLVEVDV